MNAINAGAPAQMSNSQVTNRMINKAKSMGVPDSVISQGKSAIKAWAKGNGKIPGGSDNNKADKAPGVGSERSLSTELAKNNVDDDQLLKALEDGPEATKQLFEDNDFSIDLSA